MFIIMTFMPLILIALAFIGIGLYLTRDIPGGFEKLGQLFSQKFVMDLSCAIFIIMFFTAIILISWINATIISSVKELNIAMQQVAEGNLDYSLGDDSVQAGEFEALYKNYEDMRLFMDFLSEIDFSPLFISLKTGFTATVFSFFLGIWAARKIVKMRPTFKAFWDGILVLPLVLPPTVAGYFLLMIFSLRRPFGAFLYENFQFRAVQTWIGCVIAATVIAFPLMYKNARAAFEQVDPDILHAGRTLGMSETKIFWKVLLPAAGPGVISGTILTFTRAMGEFGATAMLAGNIPGKTGTISQRIAMVMQDNDYATAGFWSAVVMIIAFIAIYFINILNIKLTQN